MWILRCALIVTLVFLPAGSFEASTFLVTKTTDTNDAVCDSDCSLREAVVAANANAGSDAISIPAGNYLLPGPYLSVEEDVSISGSGQLSTVLDGGNSREVFRILPAVTVGISDLTIQNGNAYAGGGAVFNRGTLAITDSTLDSNRAKDRGGAIWNGSGAMLTLTNTTVSDNIVLGGVYPNGGGIYNDDAGTVVLVNTTVSGNSARDGAGIYNQGVLTLTNSTISGNIALGDAGGFYNSASGAVYLTNSTISENTAVHYGGGGYNYGEVTIVSSTVSGNAADYGGGIDNEGLLTLNNSTLSGNSATKKGGAIFSTDDLDLLNSTVSGNTADIGGGFFTGYLGGPVKMEIENSIVSDNDSGANCDGDLLDSKGHNLTDDASCSFSASGDMVVGDARIGSLANNGGPTKTRYLLSDSPAIDAAAAGSCPATDQRGELRPFDGDSNGTAVCDIGAVEFLPEPEAWQMLLIGAGFMASVGRRRARSRDRS